MRGKSVSDGVRPPAPQEPVDLVSNHTEMRGSGRLTVRQTTFSPTSKRIRASNDDVPMAEPVRVIPLDEDNSTNRGPSAAKRASSIRRSKRSSRASGRSARVRTASEGKSALWLAVGGGVIALVLVIMVLSMGFDSSSASPVAPHDPAAGDGRSIRDAGSRGGAFDSDMSEEARKKRQKDFQKQRQQALQRSR